MVTVTGLGTGCPLPTATAFNAVVPMWLGGGGCGSGTLSLPVFAGNGVDTAFVLSVISQGPAPGVGKLVRKPTPMIL